MTDIVIEIPEGERFSYEQLIACCSGLPMTCHFDGITYTGVCSAVSINKHGSSIRLANCLVI